MNHYKFIFDDVIQARIDFGYNYNIEKYNKDLQTYLSHYKKNKLWLLGFDFIKGRKNFDQYDILFIGTKMIDFVKAANKVYRCGVIIRGKRSRQEISLHECDTFFGDYWVYRLYSAASRKSNKEEAVKETIYELSAWIKMINPKYIILFSNTGFFERAIISAAHISGITTIKLQHGMPHHNEGDLRISNVSDYIWVWNDYFKDFIVSNTTINPNCVKVFGYPHELINKEWPKNVNAICFLGQQDSGAEPTPENKYMVLQKLDFEFKKRGLNIFYRPHPTERMSQYRYILDNLINIGIDITPPEESLKDALQKYDMFISFFSTSLIDAYMNKRYCLQIIMDWHRKVDIFEDMGIGKTVHFDGIRNVEDLINASINNSNDIKHQEIEISDRIKLQLNQIERKIYK